MTAQPNKSTLRARSAGAETDKAREFFAALESKLSPEARRCDVGIYVREAGGPFVNNFREGRSLTIRERLKWLLSKMNERRLGRWESVTLAGLFPDDAAVIKGSLHKSRE